MLVDVCLSVAVLIAALAKALLPETFQVNSGIFALLDNESMLEAVLFQGLQTEVCIFKKVYSLSTR